MKFDLYVIYDKKNQVDNEMQNENCYNKEISKEEAWIAYLSNQLNPEEMEEVFKMNENKSNKNCERNAKGKM